MTVIRETLDLRETVLSTSKFAEEWSSARLPPGTAKGTPTENRKDVPLKLLELTPAL